MIDINIDIYIYMFHTYKMFHVKHSLADMNVCTCKL